MMIQLKQNLTLCLFIQMHQSYQCGCKRTFNNNICHSIHAIWTGTWRINNPRILALYFAEPMLQIFVQVQNAFPKIIQSTYNSLVLLKLLYSTRESQQPRYVTIPSVTKIWAFLGTERSLQRYPLSPKSNSSSRRKDSGNYFSNDLIGKKETPMLWMTFMMENNTCDIS